MADESVLLGELAEQFSARVRQGQLPDIEEYARDHPSLAARIRELFPTLMLLEGMAGAAAPSGETPRSPSDLAAGQTFGAYRIEREIGRGGMGVIYEAVHLALAKRVALKVLPIQGPRQAGQLERFLREAKTAAGLHHTNIVPVFDVGQVAGTPYYAMQLIDGQGRFERAAAITGAPVDVHEDRVVLHLFLGDQGRYRSACAELWDRYGGTDQALAVVHLATLGPDAVKDLAPLLQRAEKAHAENRCSPQTLGGILYRAGRFPDAVAVLKQAASEYSPGYSEHAYLLLALAHHRLGHSDEARRWMQEADKGIERFAQEALHPERASGASWRERVQLSILRREVEALLKSSN
jgi:hypothetical protein